MTIQETPAQHRVRLLHTGTGTLLLLLCTLLASCGGGTAGGSNAAVGCDPATTPAQCGTVLIGLTDADGDFVSYSVEIESVTLETADGRTIDTLPRSTRVDFAQYVELTEIVSAASVPPGTYVAGSITIDYMDADVFVDSGGAAKPAVVVDAAGKPLDRTTLDIRLDDRRQLIVTRDRPAVLTLDFDLAVSHQVDPVPTPAVAVAAPFIVAELDPVDRKEIRVRGPLVEVNEARMRYTVAIRPFHDRNGDFGRVEVRVTDDTGFDVDGTLARGAAGLRALAAAGAGTATVARGTLDVATREFTADLVLAGSSIPGNGSDAVHGNIVARAGNELVLRGATVVPRDARAWFRDDVTVTIGPGTRVVKRGHDALLDISALSVGQRITARGDVVVNEAASLHFDATRGAVRMHVTRLGGIATAFSTGRLDMELHSIDRRRAALFDFSGTGTGPDHDADPDRYEVATGPLAFDHYAEGKPVAVYGFPTAFGFAPPDFEGRTAVDFSDVRSLLGIGWGSAGTIAPFLRQDENGLLLDNFSTDVGPRHHVSQSPVLHDMTVLPSATLIVPCDDGRTLFAIVRGQRVRLYREFPDFVAELGASLNGSTVAHALHARGQYDADGNVFTARKIGVYLLEP